MLADLASILDGACIYSNNEKALVGFRDGWRVSIRTTSLEFPSRRSIRRKPIATSHETTNVIRQ
jgi:hypothetical protein